ncbi:MAG: aminotransferase class I/II-fold pyridoxal phosphate-dependent enzyme [Chloroflexi bacterium]|nr:aminotransferase class I/II-fold pyridoxal phosphate-dependent enzyme [Chloroflexota bacterium]
MTVDRIQNGHGQEPANPIRRAVILAAGRGDRLQPLTARLPKCLVEVGGESLLTRALHALARQGITEAVIVVGHLEEVIRERIGERFAGLDVRYVRAPDYETTNNIRSFWDARAYFDEDILLLEADVVFDDGVIAELLTEPGSGAAVAPFEREFSGTGVVCGEDRRITRFVLGAEQDASFDRAAAFKTVNIYSLRASLLREHIVPPLRRQIETGQVHDYYESVFRDLVREAGTPGFVAVDVSAYRWYEIDDHRDLDAAEFRLLDRDAQYDRIQQLHGSYWRYGFVDHSYLYNMHFPPPAMLDGFRADLPEIVTNYPVGQRELARLLADWTGADADHIAVANGAAELIKVLGNDFAGRLTIPTPSFNEYEAVISDDQLNRVTLHAPAFDLDIDVFAEAAIRWHSDTAVIVTPNNPTARSVPRDQVLRLARRLEPSGCRLIVDESFIEFSREGIAASVEGAVWAHPNLTVIKSMSKVFGIAGLRIGYLLSADREYIEGVRAALPIWNVNGFAEAFLRSVGRYRREFDESCELTRSHCRALFERLEATPGLEPLEPDANFILCKLSDSPIASPEFARRMYVEHRILVKDCAAKSMPDADRYLRIASRTPEENAQLVVALEAVLASAPAAVSP